MPLRDDPDVARRYVALLLQGLARGRPDAVAVESSAVRFLSQAAPGETDRLSERFVEVGGAAPRLFHWGDRAVLVLAVDGEVPDASLQAQLRAARAAVSLRASRGDAPPLVFLLARANAVEGRRLARVSGADLVVLSRGARPRAPLREGRSWLVGAGAHGREIGELTLVLEQAGTEGAVRVTGCVLRPMDASLPEDPVIAREAAELLERDGVSLRALVPSGE